VAPKAFATTGNSSRETLNAIARTENSASCYNGNRHGQNFRRLSKLHETVSNPLESETLTALADREFCSSQTRNILADQPTTHSQFSQKMALVRITPKEISKKGSVPTSASFLPFLELHERGSTSSPRTERVIQTTPFVLSLSKRTLADYPAIILTSSSLTNVTVASQ